MIFVAAGTQDGRELTKLLLERGHAVTASVVSHYGEQLLAAAGGSRLVINDEPLDEEGLVQYLQAHGIRLFVDASHPYAVHVSQNAMSACRRLGIPYIRYERSLTELSYEGIVVVHSYEEAAAEAAARGRVIFLTTGSRNLKKFTEAGALADCTLIARVLPTAEVLALCEELGLTPKQVVALQGPFSTELNRELFKKYHADVIVTKNSGTIGGTDTKLAAAAALHLPVIVIDRPVLQYDHLAHTYEDVLSFVEENH
ncbi:precorrin-6A reductase [uncultured Mitsuokella sp.]|uniref:precorrin-6A reductase n=1 Tax=uncultured Mitsuokella sp. TaxID=453120 RepID=UPI0026213468|nr:precorrin-6A reductase [uncultured Mitsuokella sp.]